ncbi:MAG: YceH family protein [Elusimicrobiota bacterium]
MKLNAIELRILGSLVEKSFTTPELYPLTMNSLINACNQKSSRDPVMDLDADTAARGVHTLIEKGLIEREYSVGNRVPKFKHHIEKLIGSEDIKMTAVACVLILRGPQTPGEIKTRIDRMCTFASSAEVDGFLQDLSARGEQAWVMRSPRQSGQKEVRYQHLFADDAPVAAVAPVVIPANDHAPTDRVALLEKRVAALEAEVRSLKAQASRPEVHVE